MKNKRNSSSPPRWSSPEVVAKFASSAPNARLMRFAASELSRRRDDVRLLDIGCGAGCNAVPLARMGWNVLGVDLSPPMLEAAKQRAQEQALTDHLQFQHAPMDNLPVENQRCDLVVAHGIWNLARSSAEFRRAVREAARVARSGAALFVFTFSRHTLSAHTEPIPGEPFIFTQFSGEPQCFLTKQQLVEELAATGFIQEPGEAIIEYNRTDSAAAAGETARPVLYEGIFRRH
jgi:ubiquinone/menaquinone biosynthesis C-methylase UbiE